jgi:peptidyl-prolyl cis-trans isomerase C
MRTPTTSLLTLIAVFLAGCAAEEPAAPATDLGEVIVTVDGESISEPMLAYYSRSRAQKDTADLSEEERDGLMEELIQLRLIANAAEASDTLTDSEFLAEIELQRLQLVARRQITNHLQDNPVTDAELQATYEANLEQFAGEQYKARHILVEAEQEAIDIIAELQQGADFQELARERSTGPSGPNGGDLGWFEADRMVPPFASAVREMEAGSFSEAPVQTRFGWHVIFLEERSDARAPGLDAVRADVTQLVEQQKVENYLEELRANAIVERQ